MPTTSFPEGHKQAFSSGGWVDVDPLVPPSWSAQRSQPVLYSSAACPQLKMHAPAVAKASHHSGQGSLGGELDEPATKHGIGCGGLEAAVPPSLRPRWCGDEGRRSSSSPCTMDVWPRCDEGFLLVPFRLRARGDRARKRQRAHPDGLQYPACDNLGVSCMFLIRGDDSLDSSSWDTPLELPRLESSNSRSGNGFFSASAKSPLPSADAQEERQHEFDDREFIPAELELASTPERGCIVGYLDSDGGHLYEMELRHELGT